MLRGILHALERLVRRPETVSAKDPPGAAIRRYIERYQRDAWDNVGLTARVHDPSYPFSGYFDPPDAVEHDIAYIIVMTNSMVGRL
jgi:hypothetical protein